MSDQGSIGSVCIAWKKRHKVELDLLVIIIIITNKRIIIKIMILFMQLRHCRVEREER